MLCAYFDIVSATPPPGSVSEQQQPSVTLENPSPNKLKKRKASASTQKKKVSRVKPTAGFVTSRTPLAGFKKLHDEIDVPGPTRDTFTDTCEEFEEATDALEDEKHEGPWVDGGDDEDDGCSMENEDATTEGDYPDNDDDNDDARSLSCCSTSPNHTVSSYAKKQKITYVPEYSGLTPLDFEEEEEEV